MEENQNKEDKIEDQQEAALESQKKENEIAKQQEIQMQQKRQMETMLLTRETKALKDKLLDFVNDLIIKTNGQDPVTNFESFQVETSSRKVLKELLLEFHHGIDEIKKRCNQNEEKIKENRGRLDKNDLQMKKLQVQAQAVETFNRRVTTAESKIDQNKEQAEKRHESMKDFIVRTKEMLEARVDQITQYNEKIQQLKDAIQTEKDQNHLFKDDVVKEQILVKQNVVQIENNLKELIDRNKQYFEIADYRNTHNLSVFEGINKNIETVKIQFMDKMNQIDFKIEERIKIDDVRQNFQQLNDILEVKFKQLEDVKQTARGLIAYQKYFHPIQTQQIISQNLMKLKTAKQDLGFFSYQKQMYDQLIDETLQRKTKALREKDIDILNHVEELNKKNLIVGEWTVFPTKNITKGLDFVQQLFEVYLDDLASRKKAQEIPGQPTSVILRKTIKLGEIDQVIDQVHKKSLELQSHADETQRRLKEEQRLQELRENINKLTRKKLDFRQRDLIKRQNSFKGRDFAPLFLNGDDKADFKDKMNGPEFARAVSRQLKDERQRPIPYEYKIDFEPGANRKLNESQLSASDIASDKSDDMKKAESPENKGVVASQAHGDSVIINQGMDAAQKEQFIREIKVELKPLINQISTDNAEKAVRPIRLSLEDYVLKNEDHKKQIIDKFEKELLKLSEHTKKMINKLQTNFDDQIRGLQKLRARDKSDNELAQGKLSDRIEQNTFDIERHSTNFDTIAQTISLLSENINLQMESEYADLLDRQMMALYGMHKGNASKVDFATHLKSKVRNKPFIYNQQTVNNQSSLDEYTLKDNKSKLKEKENTNQKEININDSDENIDEYEEYSNSKADQNSNSNVIKKEQVENHDDIRKTSGEILKRDEMTVVMDSNCLSHQTQGHDAQMTMKLFKIACLAYKPNKVHYRHLILDRYSIIQIRRSLIDKLTNILPLCDLFKNSAFYPKRYFDELMVEETGFNQQLYNNMSKIDLNFKKMVSSTNTVSEINIGGSPTHINLNSNSSKVLQLPEIRNQNITQNLAFGKPYQQNTQSNMMLTGQNNVDARTRNTSQFLENMNNNQSGTQLSSKQFLEKLRAEGNLTTKAIFNQTDIKRNLSMAQFMGTFNSPNQTNIAFNKLLTSSRKNIQNDKGLTMANTTVQLIANRDRTMERAAVEFLEQSSTKFQQLNQDRKKNKDSEFHKRNNSTVSGQIGMKIEVDGQAINNLKGLKNPRPSIGLPSYAPMKPKVSFDLNTILQ